MAAVRVDAWREDHEHEHDLSPTPTRLMLTIAKNKVKSKTKVTVWHCGSVLDSINSVAPRQTQLVLGWLCVF